MGGTPEGEEWVKIEGRRGGNYVDITAEKNGRTLRINTVDTEPDGITPTYRELKNARNIRRAINFDNQPGDPYNHLVLIPKQLGSK